MISNALLCAFFFLSLVVFISKSNTYIKSTYLLNVKLVLKIVMSLLNSVGNVLLTDLVVKTLKNNNIFNTLDFLQEDSAKLVNITKLTYKEVLNIRRHIFKKYGADVTSGTNYHKKLLSSFAILPTCIAKLDEALQGGLRCGKITEIYGLPDSGKTQLALSIASNVSHELKQNVLYIDTKCDFSARRIHQMLVERCVKDSEMGDILERIKVIRLFNINHLISFFHELRCNENMMKAIRLIIIDSLPAVMLQFQGDKTKESLGLLNHFVNVIRFIGVTFNVPFIIINLLTRWVETVTDQIDGKLTSSHTVEFKPSLGKYWKHIPYTSLCIEKPTNRLHSIEISVETYNIYTDVNRVTLNLSSKGVT